MCRLYIKYLRPIATYTCKAWTGTKENEKIFKFREENVEKNVWVCM